MSSTKSVQVLGSRTLSTSGKSNGSCKSLLVASPLRNPMHNFDGDENQKPSNNIILANKDKLSACVVDKPDISASTKKKRKPKRKQNWIQADGADNAQEPVTSKAALEREVSVSSVIAEQNQRYSEMGSETEKEQVLAALRSFIKVMDSHKRKFLALPPGPVPKSNKKNAKLYPKAKVAEEQQLQAQPQQQQEALQLSGRKRNRDCVAGCGTFVIPYSAVKEDVAPMEAADAPAVETDNNWATVATNLASKLDSLVDETVADVPVDEEPTAEVPLLSSSQDSADLGPTLSLAQQKLGGLTPTTFLQRRPSLCSPITAGLRFSATGAPEMASSSADAADLSPGSVCLDSSPSRGHDSLNFSHNGGVGSGSALPITIEMFQSVDHSCLMEYTNADNVDVNDDDADVDMQIKRAKSSVSAVTSALLGGLSPLRGQDITVTDYSVKKDFVEFAVQTEKCGEVKESQRRYSDFQQLHSIISSLIAEIAPLPPKQRFTLFGRWKSQSFLERRRAGLQDWLRNVLDRLEATIHQDEDSAESARAVEAFAIVRDFLSSQFEGRGNASS